jgi:hypothetical protein
VTFGPDGSAYALQFGTNSREVGQGSIVRRWPDGQTETIASGLTFPTAIIYGPDDRLYVSEIGHKSENETGRILRIRLPSGA